MPDRPTIEHGGARAFYRPSTDSIGMPPRPAFESVDAYYAVLFHELAHSTGHQRRLARPEVVNGDFFGGQEYSKEELTAELASAFLSAQAGLDVPIERSASYIEGWLSVLRHDHTMLVRAAGLAQRAADYVQGISFKQEESEPEAPLALAA